MEEQAEILHPIAVDDTGETMDPIVPQAGPASPDGSFVLARRMSVLLSPPIVALICFWVLADAYGGTDRWRVYAISALTQGLLPIAYLQWAVHRGWIGDVDMSARAERRLGLPLLGLTYLAGSVVALLLDVPAATLTVCLCTLVVLAGIWVANLFYKASGHVAGVAAYVTVLSLFVQMHLGWLIIPALAWARVRSGAHTVAQTLWGLVIGAFLTWACFTTFYEGMVLR